MKIEDFQEKFTIKDCGEVQFVLQIGKVHRLCRWKSSHFVWGLGV